MRAVFDVLLSGDPLLDLFLVIGLGILVGRIRVGGIELGSTTGVLIVGLLFGHMGAVLPTTSHSVGL
jgi:putative transport protein